MNKTREIVISKIQKSLKDEMKYQDVNFSENIFKTTKENLLAQFIEKLNAIGGTAFYCSKEEELIRNISEIIALYKAKNVFCIDKNICQLLDNGKIGHSNNDADFFSMNVGITTCEYLIANLGSVLISSKLPSGRRLHIYPPTHIIIAKKNQLLPNLTIGLSKLKQRYLDELPSMISIITGSSRTADIEKKLIMGAHGPQQLFVLITDDFFNLRQIKEQ